MIKFEGIMIALGDVAFPMKKYTDEQKAQIVTDMRNAGLEI